MPSREKLAEFVAWCGKNVTGDETGQAQTAGHISFPVKGDNVIEDVRYQPPSGRADLPVGQDARQRVPTTMGRVWINDRQYIEGVPETAWDFPIGGYLPAQRWLKDRIGRTLGYDEREEYQRIIWALMETGRLMGEIDASIKQYGGWPMK